MTFKITAPVRIDISAGWPDSDPYRRDFSGAVFNAAINLRVSAKFHGVSLVTSLENVPQSSGLGTSGALRAAYIAASNPGLMSDKADLVKRVHIFENQVLGQRAGFQDEAAAIYGGVNYWEFGSNGSIRRVPVSQSKARGLEKRIVIINTGESHLSSNIHDLVFGPQNYERNISKLDRMKAIAYQMFQAVEDSSRMNELIKETWDLQKSLDKSIETPIMRELQRKLDRTYLAARATGAGGGGCMIFYTDDKLEFLKSFHYHFTQDKVSPVPFKFDYEGLREEK